MSPGLQRGEDPVARDERHRDDRPERTGPPLPVAQLQRGDAGEKPAEHVPHVRDLDHRKRLPNRRMRTPWMTNAAPAVGRHHSAIDIGSSEMP